MFWGVFFGFSPHQQKQAKYRNVIMNTDINFIEHKSIGNAITYDECSVEEKNKKNKRTQFFLFISSSLS